MYPDIADGSINDVMINNLRAGLQSLALTASPPDVALLNQTEACLSFMYGYIAGLESRLKGYADAVPEQALEGVVQQHFGTEQTYFLPLARALARDVRLLCFFPALERGQS